MAPLRDSIRRVDIVTAAMTARGWDKGVAVRMLISYRRIGSTCQAPGLLQLRC